MRFNVIIIGGGLSGLTAGIALSKAGKKVVIISAGQNSLHFHSGSFDLLGYTPNGEIVDKPLDGMQTLGVNHPYVKIGIDNIPLLADKAQELLTEAGVKVIGNTEQNHYRLTPVGVMKPTWLTAEELVISETYNRLPWKKVDIVNIKGFLDFPTAFLAAGLNKYATECEIKTISTKVTDNARRSPTEMRATNIAKLVSNDEDIETIAQQLNLIETDSELFILPAVLGFNNREAIEKLHLSTKKPLKMVATLPPSVSGVRATILLKKLFNRYGGTYLLGNTVVSGSIKNNKIVSIQTEKMQDEDLEAEYFILSSGSFLSHGLSSNYRRIYEPVFDLDVDATLYRADWSKEYIFDSQPYMEFGVKTDAQFHAMKGGKTIDNLYATGSVLSGHNNLKLADGTGVSLLTALKVAENILK